MYNSKNYKTDGGDTLVIGGKLQIEEGAEVVGLSTTGGGSVTSADITDATAIGRSLLKAVDAAGARTSIGAGTPYTLPVATATVVGGVKKAATQADSTATDIAGLVADFNALKAKLVTAGIMA